MSIRLPHRPRATLFDLDGTLVDSVPDLAESVDELMRQLGRTPWGTDQVMQWVGNGVETLVQRALTGTLHETVDRLQLTRAVEQFGPIYEANNGKFSHLYPGVAETLDTLHQSGMLLGVVTNKPAAFTAPLLAMHGVARYFSVVVSGDTVANKKPHPEPLEYALSQLAVDRHDAVFVGDSVHDVDAANAAKMSVVCVSYGYNHGVDIRTAAPLAVIDSLAELQPLFG